MLRLDTTTRKLQALLGGSITTNQLPITVCYSDKTSTAYTGGTTVINTNNTTAVDICAAPAASTVRDIDTINVNNADTVAATITIRYNDNGTTYTLFKAQLETGDQLTYVHGDGWKVLDSAGVVKSFSPTDLKLSSFAPTTSAELATVITDETGSGLLVFGTSPTLTTPNIGAATATTINGNTITAGTGTLTLGAGSTLATSATNSITLTSTGATNVTLPTTGTLATLAGTETLSSKTLNLVSGAVGTPSLYLNSETTSGLYRIGANNHGWSISGAKVLDISSAGLGVTGTFTSSGNAGVGVASNAARALEVGSTSLTGTTQIGAAIFPTFSSGATSSVRGVNVSLTLADASYTVTNLYGLLVAPTSGGAGATVTQEYGVDIGALSKGASVVGLRSQVAAATNFWNLYISGTANNAFAGNVRIGSTTAPTNALDVTGVATVSSNFTAAGQASLGTATVVGYIKHRLLQTFTSDGASSVVYGTLIDGTITTAAGDTSSVNHFRTAPSGVITAGAGEVYSLISSAYFSEPAITLTGADTVTTAATVYIANAPTEGVSNYALLANGATLFGTTSNPGNNVFHQFTNTFTSGGASVTAIGFRINGTITAAAGDTTRHAHFHLDPTGIVTQGATEAISLVTSAYISEPVITVGTGDTITTAATVYIASAPTEGVDNYALVANGGVLIGTTTGGGNHTKHFISNTFTSGGASTVAYGTRITGTVTAAAGDTARHASFLVNPTSMVTQGATEAITLVTSAYFTEPVITVGTGDTITTAATIYIENAPTEGATNAALYVASGASIFAGNTRIGSTTAPTVALDVTGAVNTTSTVTVNGAIRLTSTGVLDWITNGTTAVQNLSYPSIYATGSGGGAYPFTEAGHLVLEPRNSGASRDVLIAGTAGSFPFVFKNAGLQLINDTSNANSTVGLTINQGANDNEILSLKSSDVAHGMTSVTETDTYGYISKFSATDGGAFFDGLADTGATGLRLRGVMVTANTTKTTGGLAAVMIDSALKSTTTVASSGADANMVAFRDNGTTRFILDADGDSHQDVGTAWTNFDHLDDVATLDALAYNVARPDDPIKRKFGEFLKDKREVLEQQRLVTFNDDGHHFVNMSKLTMLHTGAIRQIGEKLEMAERVIERLTNQLQRLEMNHANPNH